MRRETWPSSTADPTQIDRLTPPELAEVHPHDESSPRLTNTMTLTYLRGSRSSICICRNAPLRAMLGHDVAVQIVAQFVGADGEALLELVCSLGGDHSGSTASTRAEYANADLLRGPPFLRQA